MQRGSARDVSNKKQGGPRGFCASRLRRGGEDSGAAGEREPFFFQSGKIGARCIPARDHDQPNPGAHLRSARADEFAQAAAGSIPHHRTTDSLRGDEADARRIGRGGSFEKPEHHQPTMDGFTAFLDPAELRGLREPRGLWKTERWRGNRLGIRLHA